MKRVMMCWLALTIAAAGFATGLREEVVEVEQLRLAYPQSVSSIPLLALVDEHPQLYSGEFFNDHSQALARLITGEIDVLATGFTIGYSRHRSAGDIVHLMTPVWGVSALMTAEPVESLRDLVGGTIYAPFEGSPIDIYLRAVIAEADLAGEIRIAYAPFPQAAALVAEGKAEAAVLVEPIASRLEIQGMAHRLENLHDGWARIASGERRSPQVSVFTMADSATVWSDQLDELVERLAEITADVAARPAVYAARYAEALGFPTPIVERALMNTLFDTPDPTETRHLIDLYSVVVGSAPPSDSFFGVDSAVAPER